MKPAAIIKQIFISPASGGDLLELSQVMAVAGKGLEGDRNFRETADDNQNAVTLISEDAVQICRQRIGRDFPIEQFRRNLIVSGVELNQLVNLQFRVGDAVFTGYELCHPCQYLSGLLGADMLAGLADCGGLRAKITRSAIIKCGDKITII